MELEIEGRTASIAYEAIKVMGRLGNVREEFKILSNDVLEKTYWSLLGAMVFSGTSNAEVHTVEDGRVASWYTN